MRSRSQQMNFLDKTKIETQDPLRKKITQAYRQDEGACIEFLLKNSELPDQQWHQIENLSKELIQKARESKPSALDSFMAQYDLSSEEGIALMCLAEALLRIPDPATVDKLIKDKLVNANWEEHLGESTSLFVNAATWGLMLTGNLLRPEQNHEKYWKGTVKKLVSNHSEPVIRKAIQRAMSIMGRQFVLGETIESALKRSKEEQNKHYAYSFDMLGEAARTEEDAKTYFKAYQKAIHAIGAGVNTTPIKSNGISVKLSALHPRFEANKRPIVVEELTPRLHELALLAKKYNIGLTVDAEEADRLDLTLDVFEKVFTHADFNDWEGLGIAVQAYQKRAPYVLDWLQALSERNHRRIMVRLVKGAYWDTEIKQSQVLGLNDYPVYTRKQTTDVSYLVCARKMIDAPHAFYAQFATHNAVTIATILSLMKERRDFEFQRLHGMGGSLYDYVLKKYQHEISCRVYAPVGGHQHLLAYLVRRLLENGANTSFVNRLHDKKASLESLVNDPVARLQQKQHKRHPSIVLPKNIYGQSRENSPGIDFSNRECLETLQNQLQNYVDHQWQAGPMVNGQLIKTEKNLSVLNPANHRQSIGHIYFSDQAVLKDAFRFAKEGFLKWRATPVAQRAACLQKFADLLIEHQDELFSIAVLEGGKTLPNALGEVREAVDFCRYYAAQALEKLEKPIILPGPTGEENQLSYHGRGVFVCISPWNFPLAIFVGQLAAALVTGNTVLAKPAEQTGILAYRATQLAYQAGIPADVLQLLPGTGEVVGSALVSNPDIAGVMFTGSTETARVINQSLANRNGPIIPFIAETGGQNAMIVDSSALLEQVTADIIYSAFDSAGQRCSALRVLFVQEDIADDLIKMLLGAMKELVINDPRWLTTDIGPVIDKDALEVLQKHCENIKKDSLMFYQCELPEPCNDGTFLPPTLVEIKDMHLLTREVFGPVLHVIRYPLKKLDNVIKQINETGYGLTFGVHSRIEDSIEAIYPQVNAGNIYVNRNMIGAVVGVQPFGGQGLSGTGPKAGGPNYLMRLVEEQSVSINTTALGGNASLLSLDDDLD